MLYTCHINYRAFSLLIFFLFLLILGYSVPSAAEDGEPLFLAPNVKPLIQTAYNYAAQRDRRSLKLMRDKAIKPLKEIAERSVQNENYGQAIYIYKELYQLYKQVHGEHHRKTLNMYSRLANTYQLAEKFTEQIKILQYLVKHYETQFGSNYRSTWRYLENLAFAYRQNKAYIKSAETYERLLKIYRDNGMSKNRKYQLILGRVADLYIQQGDYHRAAPYFMESEGIKPGEKINLTVMNMTKYYNYAQMLQISGKYAEAEDLYKQMLAFSKSQSKSMAMSVQMPVENIYAHLGALYHQIGAYDKALEYKQQAYEGYAKTFGKTSVLTAYMLNNMAETYLALKQYDKALSSMKIVELVLAPQIKKKNALYIDKNFAMPTLALAYSKVGQYKKAEEIFLTSLDELGKEYSPRHVLVTYAKSNLAEIYYLQNRLDEAEKTAFEALSAATANKAPLLLARIYFVLARIRHKQSFTSEAIFYGKQGINYIQSLRSGLVSRDKSLQKSFVDSQQENYEVLAGWLIDAGRLSEAEQVLAMLKEEEYFNFIRRNQVNNPKATMAELTAIEAEQRQNLIKSSSSLIKYAQKLDELERLDPEIRSGQDKRQIKKYKKLLKVAQNNFEQTLKLIRAVLAKRSADNLSAQLDIGAYQALLNKLGDDVALVHVLPLEKDLRILLRTTRGNFAKKLAVDKKTFNKKINAYKQLVKRPDKPVAKLVKSSREIYNWIIGPIKSELSQANIKTLMFYKNGVLRYIPLATLHDGKAYLIEKYAISNYTAAAKESFNHAAEKQWQVAGLGVSKQHGNFSPLRMVPYELDSIVKTSNTDPNGIYSGQVFLDETFTKRQFKKSLTGNYNVSHIATHYKFIPGTESDSFLLMGDGSHLSLATLRSANYDFKSIDLLTLSACETAVSDTAADGREVEGLATLVQKQGARGVIATLWPVADCSTGQFMKRFYQNRNLGISKAEALRKTQVAFLSNKVPVRTAVANDPAKGCQLASTSRATYRHPYFWAPFILMGNWN